MKKLLCAILIPAILLTLFSFSFAATGNITNITVTGTANAASYALGGTFDVGAVIWSDRSWETVNCVIDEMKGAQIIKTHYADSKFAGTVSFDIDVNSEVYVYMNYATGNYAIPWAKDWTYLGTFETINGANKRVMHAYKKAFPAGSTVTLEGAGSGANLMYGIAVNMNNVYIPVVPAVTKLNVTGTANTASYALGDTFDTGAVIWSDRTHEPVSTVIDEMKGAKIIKTHYGDAKFDGTISFDINVNSAVYVYINYQTQTNVISWAKDWEYVGTFETSKPRTMYVYKKIFPANSTVTLNGAGKDSNLMYGVAVVMDENIKIPVVPAITNLKIPASTNDAGYAIDGAFGVGSVIWTDRNWETVTTSLDELNGAKLIKTYAADAKMEGGMSFDINVNSVVYVYCNYETQQYVIPWAKDWDYAGTFQTSSRDMYVYKKIFPANSTVALEAPGSSTNLMYGVAVVMDENIVVPVLPEITNLKVNRTANAASYKIGGKFGAGSLIWTDRAWETVNTTIPAIEGATIIQTHYEDGNKDNRDNEADKLSFEINKRAEVYILINFEAGPYAVPFAQQWEYVGTFETTQPRTMYVYKRVYPAGAKVVLDGTGTGSNLMYGVAVQWKELTGEENVTIFPEVYKEELSGITFGTLKSGDVKEYGIVVSDYIYAPVIGDENCKVYKSIFSLNSKNQFGVKLVGLTENKTYYTRVYAIYGNGENAVTVYSDALEFTAEN